MPRIHRRSLFALAALLAAVALPSSGALAQSSPGKPLRMVIPYPPGGPTDALGRLIAQELQTTLGVPVVVENKPGASGAIGTREVAKSPADGDTIVLGNNQTHVTNAFLLKEPGYDIQKDFVGLAGLADLQHMLVVRKDLPVNSVAELIALAKKDPGKLNYGSTGAGSGSHLTMELFKTRTGTDMAHIPFRGAAPMALEVVAGRIDVAFATLPSVLGQITGGEMKAIAVASSVRAPQLPNVPRLNEQGVTGSEGDSWLALFAPASMPEAQRDRLSKAILDAMAKPDLVASATKQGIAVNVRPPQDFARYHKEEIAKWESVIKTANVKPAE
jgi:tripartite-type tricarboxylate transporter receptor subunit TctC